MIRTMEQLASEARAVWADISSRELRPKDRLAIPVQDMPCQDPVEQIGRAHV